MFLFLALMAGGAVLMPAVFRIDEGHALAGLFGEPERESAIARRTVRVLEAAESVVRLAGFNDALRQYAWNGMPLAIHRRSARWSEWAFDDGSRWLVRHVRRAPREQRRVIVAGATSTRRGLAVDTYGPGGGSPQHILDVTDAVTLT